MITYIYILILIFAIWFLILYIANKKLKKYGLEVMGPLLMWKTKKGKKFIEKISKKKIWKHYGNLSITICIIAMIFTTILLLWNLIISFQIPPQRAPSPRLILGIPGINPIIPVGYGIIAIAIAIAIHEISHGILAKFGKIEINSLGLLFLIFPIGAFVEPDEDKLKKVSRLKRSRVFAAGPSSNIIIAFVCILLLAFVFSPAIQSKEEGAIVLKEFNSIKKWSIITKVDGKKIEADDLENLIPGKFYNITFYYSGDYYTERILYGLCMNDIVKNSPAEKAGFSEGFIIYRINDTYLGKWEDFREFMENKKANEKIRVYYYNGGFLNKTIVLADKYEFTGIESDKGKGFLGIGAYGLVDLTVSDSYFKNLLNPLKTNFNLYAIRNKFFSFLTLPFAGLSPLPRELTTIYTPSNYFWILYNIVYWIFWLNFAIGTFNALPAIPLDGGYIFKDGVSFLIYRIIRKKEKSDKLSTALANAISVFILICLFSIILIPRLRSFISF